MPGCTPVWPHNNSQLSRLNSAAKLTNNVSAIDISINCYVLTSHQKCPSLLHIAPEIESKWQPLCNRDFIYQWAPVHNTRDGYWMPTSHGASLHTVPTLRQKLKYLTQHRVKRSQVADWTVNSTNSNTMKILHFNAQTKWIGNLGGGFFCRCVKTRRPAYHSNTEKWQCFCGNDNCFFSFDRHDWTTETQCKEEFNSEQTFYTKLS